MNHQAQPQLRFKSFDKLNIKSVKTQDHRLKHRWQPLAVREKSICVRSMNAESACGVRWLPFCSWEGFSVCWCRCDGGAGWWRWLGWRYWGCGSWGNIGGSWERGGKTCREVLERRVGSCTFTCLDILETWGSFMKEIQKMNERMTEEETWK